MQARVVQGGNRMMEMLECMDPGGRRTFVGAPYIVRIYLDKDAIWKAEVDGYDRPFEVGRMTQSGWSRTHPAFAFCRFTGKERK